MRIQRHEQTAANTKRKNPRSNRRCRWRHWQTALATAMVVFANKQKS